MKLRQISFMIHPFCYAWAEGGDAWAQPYLAREKACARRWYALLETFPEDAALAIIAAGRTGPTADYHAAACAALGDRCFLLDAPDCHAPQFWSDGDPDGGLLNEIRMALVGQRMAWNKEELYDALHTHACYRQFRALSGERGLTFDRHTVVAEAWGESFDGCVTKYSLNLRRVLGLSGTVAIDNVPAGYHEPPQSVVTLLANALRVPASAGVVYRLAKAPAYVFLPREMSYADASAILTSASVQGGESGQRATDAERNHE